MVAVVTRPPIRSDPKRTRAALRRRVSPRGRDAIALVAVMALALGLACAVLKTWRGSLGVPFYLGGIDTAPFVAGIKGMIDHGWYFTNPSLGVPAGQDLIDFAGGTAENVQWLLIKMLSVITGDAAVTLNVYLLLAFPAIAGTTWLVLRRLGGSRLAAAVGAVLFALLPYHFAQMAMGHAFLAAYVAVPLAGWLVLRALQSQPLFTRRDGGSAVAGWLTGRNVAMAAALVVVGGSTAYYAVFALLLLAAAGIIRAVVVRSWRGGVPAAASIVAVGTVLVLNLVPGLIYRFGQGPNPALAARKPFESEVFSLSLTQLLAPVQGHRIDALARMYEKSVESTIVVGERGNQLGSVFAVALVCGLLGVCAWALTRRGATGAPRTVAPAASVAALVAIVIGTLGGVSSLVAIYLTPQLRVWSRLAPFVAFFCAVLVVVALDWAAKAARGRWRRAWPGVAVAVVVGLLGVLDQAPPRVEPAYAQDAAAWASASRFARAVEAEVPPGARILQLPYVPFPESGAVAGVQPYDHLYGYLHSDSLAWSFGAIRGRDADWQGTVAGLPPAQMVDAAAAAGFAGVWLDRAGYADGGEAVRRAVQEAVGHSVPVVGSPDGRREFMSLDGARVHLESVYGSARVAAMARMVRTPVGWSLGPGFHGEETDGVTRWNWATTPATLVLRNSSDRVQRVRLTATVEAEPGSRVTWHGPDGRDGSVRVVSSSAPLAVTMTVPPGQSEILFRTAGGNVGSPPDGRDLRWNLQNPALAVLP